MDTNTLDLNTLTVLVILLVTLLVAVVGSRLTTVILMYRLFGRLDTKFDRLDTKFDAKFDRLDTKFDAKFDRLETRVTGLETRFTALDAKVDSLDAKVDSLDAKVDSLDAKVEGMAGDVADTRERAARIEGHLMAPGSFTTRGLGPAAPDEPRPEDPGSDPDHRQAG